MALQKLMDPFPSESLEQESMQLSHHLYLMEMMIIIAPRGSTTPDSLTRALSW